MPDKIPGERHLSGTYGKIWWDGSLVAEMTNIVLRIIANRSDVQTGLDVDSKITGLRGEGTLTLLRTYSRFADYLTELNAGRDPRVQLVVSLADPDAYGQEEERWSIGNVALSEISLANWQKGSVVSDDIPLRFTPSDVRNLSKISVRD